MQSNSHEYYCTSERIRKRCKWLIESVKTSPHDAHHLFAHFIRLNGEKKNLLLMLKSYTFINRLLLIFFQ